MNDVPRKRAHLESTASDASVDASSSSSSSLSSGIQRDGGATVVHSDQRHMQLNPSDDLRIRAIHPLIPPQILMEDIPMTTTALSTVQRARVECQNVIAQRDDRLLVIVGPCSIHDPAAARVYAQRLREQIGIHAADLVIVMRVYFEKPRTTVGWKGLINDPFLDGSFKINKGLHIARQLLCDVNEMGVPAGVEFLDTITPQFLCDFISWGAIGARTTESQIHRELASGLSCPVGYKNGTSGSVDIAVDAIRASKAPHHFLGVNKYGLAAIVTTDGNPSCHLILRGGKSGPNYGPSHIAECSERLEKASVNTGIMVDCSHGNSNKDYRNQPKVAAAVAEQLAAGARNIIGVMIESNLHEGRQDINPETGLPGLQYGVSVTDGCIHWDDTVAVLETLAAAVRSRRNVSMAQ
ncbi:phospho-2-dehydro-3-deoxyheptonate aldolase [Capsaspora owczarzaki ATCC 30864]|uniref:3-deoxy-7-phosphoheptulonate synthase n=1 Tax=Capsaspora owczarzaki (strain ATCC 30864) TaxID=595528 RepID=A0A0D2X467_CAPO3|nr:phospho-2-dehydro-3-deoxyheptonate aldolase [Capsaspora owczarzaki ATCC 30864]KJE95529.1 phospho-2-dehydro-3-deoxyheptonate aldolase [Capsaspora owczarzaki ATCC 30864]|eukprot:XP_004345567.2 phospho-2-dehydro-3-deoxyheptonate aldolase [Capsaspora owczarzaki ATCC 30864]